MTAPDLDFAAIEREPLALVLFAAWVNYPVDKLPPEMKGHTCADTMEAWGRVADAARKYLSTPDPEVVEVLQCLVEIMDNSNGVAGWHLNGDVAEWEWFEDVDRLRALLAKMEGER